MSRRDGSPAVTRRAPAPVRDVLATLYAGAIAAVDPTRLARRALLVERRRVVVRGWRGRRAALPLRHGILVVGAGKGAAGLAAGVEAVLGPHVVGGVVIVPAGYECKLGRIEVAEGSHPIPDRRSLDATRRVLAALDRYAEAAVLVLLTGGASSLLAAPAAGLTGADERWAGSWLLASGVDIAAMNAVRKHLSAITGGRLAALLVGRPAAALVVSDVPGDDLAVVGSGPTVADPTTYADALAVLTAAGRSRRVPQRVRRHLERGARGEIAETPKPGTPAARACPTILIASNATARAGGAAVARRQGFTTIVTVRRPIAGGTAAAARGLAEEIARCQARLHGRHPAVVLAGGETTVTLGAEAGRGGRNQELAVTVARELAERPGWALLAAGSDGIDGPTDAAGAFADGATGARAARAGLSLPRALARHDVYPCLARLGDLFTPGPTGTNVADLVIAIVWKDRGWQLPSPVIQAKGRR